MGIVRGLAKRVKKKITGSSQSSQVLKTLLIEELEVGTGAEATLGSSVGVHYTGRLEDGTEFDSSLRRGPPLFFTLGAGQVIRGWEQGIVGMKEGGKRKLTIPPRLAYGKRGAGEIPPYATLIFDVHLVKVTV